MRDILLGIFSIYFLSGCVAPKPNSSGVFSAGAENLVGVSKLPNILCNGASSDQNGLQNALVSNGPSNHLDLLIDCPLVLDGDIEFGKNISLHFQNAGKITVAPGASVKLKILGDLVAEPYQIFSKFSPGQITFDSHANLTEINPEWFGALGDGGDDALPLRIAFSSLGSGSGQYVYRKRSMNAFC